ncbi:hypothetical protein EDB92DRAFT_1814977 [Lactarius akahatsu]|uniref:Uncharacterized protein n=1 Tax=Lactarius akahatsu TaxID=416441 RepID=A0AAD4LKH5_9AGAM|nr:hypothetical protein EDB92DRAFT_1814977 [Lactarius akahatsu]
MQHIETASREDRRILRINTALREHYRPQRHSTALVQRNSNGKGSTRPSNSDATRTWDIYVQNQNILYLVPTLGTLVGPNINSPTNVIYTMRKEHAAFGHSDLEACRDTPNNFKKWTSSFRLWRDRLLDPKSLKARAAAKFMNLSAVLLSTSRSAKMEGTFKPEWGNGFHIVPSIPISSHGILVSQIFSLSPCSTFLGRSKKKMESLLGPVMVQNGTTGLRSPSPPQSYL